MTKKQDELRILSTERTEKMIGADNEVTLDRDRKTLVYHDGKTRGGFPIGRVSETVQVVEDLAALKGLGSVPGKLKDGYRFTLYRPGYGQLTARWDASSTATANDVNVVAADGVDTGRFIFDDLRQVPTLVALATVASAGFVSIGDVLTNTHYDSNEIKGSGADWQCIDDDADTSGLGAATGTVGGRSYWITDKYLYVEAPTASSAYQFVENKQVPFPDGSGVLSDFYGFEDKIVTIIAGVDSLTDGAGSNGGAKSDSYINIVENSLIAMLGDAGAGWTPLDNRGAARDRMNIQRSTAGSDVLNYIHTQDKSLSPAKYSFDFGGLYSDSATTSSFFIMGWNLAGGLDRDWDTVDVYYLQQPGGATIQFFQTGTPSASRVTTDTDGALSLQKVTITANKSYSNQIEGRVNGAGALAVFGLNWKRDVTSGVRVGRQARGGYKTSEFAALDATFQSDWFSELNPTHYFFNGGRNDISVPDSASTFIGNVETLFSRLPAACQILVMAPNASSTDGTSGIREYRQAMRDLCQTEGYGFIDNSEVLGTYADAVQAGAMLDTAHPSALGNYVIANRALTYMGSYLAPYTLPEVFTSSSGASTSLYEGTLPVAEKENVAAGGTMTVQYWPTNNCAHILEFFITVKTGAGTGMRQTRHVIRAISGGAGVAAIGTEDETYSYASGLGDDYTVAFSIDADDYLELEITANGGNANPLEFVVTGSWKNGGVPATQAQWVIGSVS